MATLGAYCLLVYTIKGKICGIISIEEIFACTSQRSNIIEPEHNHAHLPRRRIFRSVSEPMKWALFLNVWLFTWAPAMFVLLWWQVPLFFSLFVLLLGIGLFVFIMGQYVLARLRLELQPLRYKQGYQAQEPDTPIESPSDPQSPSSSSTWDDEQFQVPYPEPM